MTNDESAEAEAMADFDNEIRPMMEEAASEELYVIVTLADNGVVHAWGTDEGKPFLTHSQAAVERIKFKREMTQRYGRRDGVRYCVCKILGKKPE